MKVTAFALSVILAMVSAIPSVSAENSQDVELRLFPSGAQQIIGQPVIGTNGEKVGKITDVVIGRDGQVKGVLLERGGIVGVGAKQVAVDWKQFSLDSQGGVRVNLTDRQVAELPDFEKGSRTLIESAPPPRPLDQN